MQRDARALLSRLSTLRKEAENLASVDIRLELNRKINQVDTNDDAHSLECRTRTPKKSTRPLSRQRNHRLVNSNKKSRKKWSPKKGISFGLMDTKQKRKPVKSTSRKSPQRAWGAGPGGNVPNKPLDGEPQLILPNGIDDISLHVESEVLRRKAEYNRDPTYTISAMPEKENSSDVWWYVSGQGFQSLKTEGSVVSSSRTNDGDKSMLSSGHSVNSSRGHSLNSSHAFRVENKDNALPRSKEVIEKISPPKGLEKDIIDLEKSNTKVSAGKVCAPQFQEYHSKSQKIFLLQEFSRLWMKKGLGQLCASIQALEEEIASRSPADVAVRPKEGYAADHI